MANQHGQLMFQTPTSMTYSEFECPTGKRRNEADASVIGAVRLPLLSGAAMLLPQFILLERSCSRYHPFFDAFWLH